MNLGFDIIPTAAKQKRGEVVEDAPTQEPMRPIKGLARNPSTDQKKVRRQIQRKTAGIEQAEADLNEEQTMNREAALLAAMAQANLPEQRALVEELDALRGRRREAMRADRELDLADTFVTDVLTPVVTHVQHTAATDWIAEEADRHDPQVVARTMLTEASLWFQKTSAVIREDRDEFAAQAQGIARRLASQYGEHAARAERAFLDYVAFLHSRTADGEGAWPLDAPGQQQPDTTPWTEKVTTGDTQNLAELPQVASSRVADDEFMFVFAADSDKSDYPAHEQAGYAESGLPDEPIPGDDEPFDAKINDGETVLSPTGPVDVHPPMPGAGDGSRDATRKTAGPRCKECGAPTGAPQMPEDNEASGSDAGPIYVCEKGHRHRYPHTAVHTGAEQNGNAESQLPDVEVGGADDRPMWPWELPLVPGAGASNVAATPTPRGEAGYPQPRKASSQLDAFAARVRAGLDRMSA